MQLVNIPLFAQRRISMIFCISNAVTVKTNGNRNNTVTLCPDPIFYLFFFFFSTNLQSYFSPPIFDHYLTLSSDLQNKKNDADMTQNGISDPL